MALAEPPPFVAFEHRDAANGFEVAFFQVSDGAISVEGATSALEDGNGYAVSYAIEVDAGGRARRAEVRGRTVQGRQQTRLEADGNGHWTVDGAQRDDLDGVMDVDLEASALTNAFPVRRLAAAVGQRAEAPAAYVRALDLRVERLEQHYTRLDDAADGRLRFDYACPQFDVRCVLEYDASGLVLAYPGLAIRHR